MIVLVPRWLRRAFCGGRVASVPQIQFPLPSPHVFPKYYHKDALFADVDWSDWAAVIGGFRARFREWYFIPLSEFPKTGHEAYPVLCSMCALIDAFTHYAGDLDAHDHRQYKHFLRMHLDPIFATELTSPIEITRYHRRKWLPGGSLRDFADVFYVGVRCSLHHHGDLAAFAGMSGTGVLAQERTATAQSSRGQLFSIVVFDPWVLRNRLNEWFDQYCDDLEKAPRGRDARKFRRRFENDFLIRIPEP